MNAVAGLEKQLQDTKDLMQSRDLALKLYGNREFKKLIIDGFCGSESARLVHQSADPALDPLQRSDALNMAQAGGHLRRYLSMMIKMGDNAESSLKDLEEALGEARAEDDTDDRIVGEGEE